MKSLAEMTLAAQLEVARIPFERQVVFAPPRKYAADFVVDDIIIEVEGGTWTQGSHVRGKGFEAGCEKQALAVLRGYRYLRATTAQVDNGTAYRWIVEARKVAA